MVFFCYLKIFLTQTSRFQDQIFALLIFQTNQSNKYPLIPPESDETSSVKPVIFQKFEYHYFCDNFFCKLCFFYSVVNPQGISIITDEFLTRNKVCHYVLNRCITNRYNLTDIKIEKSSFPIKFVYRPSDKIKIAFLKMPNLSFKGRGIVNF